MRTPVVVVTGLDEAPVQATTMSLQWDLPGVAVVHHELDHERGVLRRVVSDVAGVVEREDVELEHPCLGCAARQQIVPTLDRLAQTGRWASLVARLPLGAAADQVCAPIATERRWARRLRIGAVVAAAADTAAGDLLGQETIEERNPVLLGDDRGVGEVLAAMIEYADVIVGSGALPAQAHALIGALAGPRAVIAAEPCALDVDGLLFRHRHIATTRWVDPLAAPDPALRDPAHLVADARGGVWQVLLQSADPFHTGRLLDSLEDLGSGPFRTRGVFWLATRPGDALLWDGAGGQLSIGTHSAWGAAAPYTRLLFTGLGTAPPGLRATFDRLRDDGWRERPGVTPAEDGFEPWLGQIRSVA